MTKPQKKIFSGKDWIEMGYVTAVIGMVAIQIDFWSNRINERMGEY